MRLIVRFKKGRGKSKRDNCHKRNRGKPVHPVYGMDKFDVELVEVDAAGLTAYQSDPDVEAVEVDAPARPCAIPNDPGYAGQWHHPKIGCPAAWDIAYGDGVTIAICDTGVDPNHPDLKDKLLPGYNSDDGSTNWSDIHGHGTAVAGTAAAIGNNGINGAGVAWNGKILPIKITNDPSGIAYMSRMAAAITWAADQGARVINLSYETYNSARTGLSPYVLNAVTYAANKGSVVVIAAGNLNMNPAGTDDPIDAIYVAATDKNDLRASFSNYGVFIDIAAPGVGIFTTKNGGGYGSWNGTSFSAPIVAGVLALMFSANPSLTVAQARQALLDNSVPLGNTDWFGAGRVNAAAAVAAVVAPVPPPPPPPPPPPEPTPTPTKPSNLKVASTYTDPNHVKGVRMNWTSSGKETLFDLMVNDRVPETGIEVLPIPGRVETARLLLYDLQVKGSYRLRVRSRIGSAVSEWSNQASITLK